MNAEPADMDYKYKKRTDSKMDGGGGVLVEDTMIHVDEPPGVGEGASEEDADEDLDDFFASLE